MPLSENMLLPTLNADEDKTHLCSIIKKIDDQTTIAAVIKLKFRLNEKKMRSWNEKRIVFDVFIFISGWIEKKNESVPSAWKIDSVSEVYESSR